MRQKTRQQQLETSKRKTLVISSGNCENSVSKSNINFPINTVTMLRNYSFDGRDSVIADVHSRFSNMTGELEIYDASCGVNEMHIDVGENGTGPVCCLFRGLAGVGKTQCALEYYYRYKRECDACFWLPSESEAEIVKAYCLIASKLKLATEDYDEGEQTLTSAIAITNARTWLEQTGTLYDYHIY